MDALGGLLDGVRARGAFVLKMSLDPPWSMAIRDDAPLTLVCVTHGAAAIVTDAGHRVDLGPGDVAVTRGIEHYRFCDSAGSDPQVVIHPGNRCTTLDGADLRFAMSVGVRTWGNSAAGADRAIVATYDGASAVSARLLQALPARSSCAPTSGPHRWSTSLRTSRDGRARVRRRSSTGCSTCS